MPVTDTHKYYMAIENELILLRSAAGVLHLAWSHLADREPEQSAVLQALHFAAMHIEAALDRIDRMEEKLWYSPAKEDDEAPAHDNPPGPSRVIELLGQMEIEDVDQLSADDRERIGKLYQQWADIITNTAAARKALGIAPGNGEGVRCP